MELPPSPAARGGPFTARDLARRLGAEVEGDPGAVLVDVRALDEAGPEHLSFLASPRYADRLAASRAGAVLVGAGVEAAGRTLIRCRDPRETYARALDLFHPLEWPRPGIDPRAYVAPDAAVDSDATVEAFAWIGPAARVEAGAWIEAGAYVGRGARVGRHCRLMAGCVVGAGSWLGDRVWLNPGVVVGGEGFGFTPTAEGHLKIPQTARAVIEDDVEIGANTCVDRGALKDTVVGRGTKIDNLVQVAHGAQVGEGCLLVAFAGVAGSARLGKGVVLAARAGALDHSVLGDGVQVAVQGTATGEHPAGAQLAGTPALDHRRWLKASAVFADLPDLLKRVRRLEARVAELEEAAGPGPTPPAG